MGAAESNPVRNMDKRTARRTYRAEFEEAIRLYRCSPKVAAEHAQLAMAAGAADDAAADDADAAAVRVCVRKRPIHREETDGLEFDVVTAARDRLVAVHDARMHSDMRHMQMHHHEFVFDRVFSEAADNDQVYEAAARPLARAAARPGGFSTVLMYGQTGSGKTFTMMGDISNYAHRGVAPRAVAHVFQEVNMRVETAFKITCTYMEIYNEKVFDLLADADAERTADYTIAEEKGGKGVFVRGLTEVVVATEQDALNLLFSGELGRTTAQHKLNRQSNRSHSVFTVYVQQQARSGVSERVISSKLNLVDLAGSERLKKTMEMDSGAPLDETLKKESMYINQSLT